MTCIAGLVVDGKVYLGADSLGTSDSGGCSTNTYKKLFRVGDFLIGCAGSPRACQVVNYTFNPPVYGDHRNDEKDPIAGYMVNRFVNDLHECFKTAAGIKEEVKGYFLVGFSGRLFGVYPEDYQIEEDVIGYNAIGNGADLAMGSLHTSGRFSMSISHRRRIEMALEASEAHNANVQRPFIIESI